MLTVAYISTDPKPEKRRQQTAKEKLHAQAIASIADWRIKAKARARKMFEREFEVLAKLELKAKILITKQ